MDIHTIGFTKRSAAEFFGALRDAKIGRVLDIRLNNTSQLAGYTKRADLPFFLREICAAEYVHDPRLAPSKEIFDEYKKKKGGWANFERRFLELMRERKIEELIEPIFFDIPTTLLCSEMTPDKCHRRLVAEYLRAAWGDLNIIHL